MKKQSAQALAICSALIAEPAMARIDTGATVFENKSEWSIFQSYKSDTCFASASFEGGVDLGLFWLPREQNMGVFVHDSALESIKEGADYKIKVTFSKASGIDDGWGERDAKGDRDADQKPGFALKLHGPEALTDVADSMNIAFWYKEKLVESLKLKGSSLMISEMRRCAAQIVKNHPIDPFEE